MIDSLNKGVEVITLAQYANIVHWNIFIMHVIKGGMWVYVYTAKDFEKYPK